MKSSVTPKVTIMLKKQIIPLLFLATLNIWFAECSIKKDTLSAGIAKLKKNVTQQTVSLQNKRFLEKPPSYLSSMDGKKRLYLLLAEYNENNPKLFFSRLTHIPKESVDLWGLVLSEKSGEEIEWDMIRLGLAIINPLFIDSLYNKPEEYKYIKRIKTIPGNAANDWKTALIPFDEEDNLPVSNSLLVMMNLDILFNESGIKNDILQKAITRLKHLEPKSIARLASILKCENMKLFAANIVVEDAFFDGDTFQEKIVEQSLTDKK